MPKVAIVILNFNGRNFLEKFLPFTIQYSANHEVIVIDNASTDDSTVFLKQAYPEVQLIQLTENNGYAGGYNIGLQKIEADYFVLLNSDVEVTENWINPVIELMEKDEKIIASQPKILSYYIRNQFEYAGAAGGFIDYLGYPFCRGRIMSTLEEDNGQYNDKQEIFWATGACLFVKAKPFFELGGLDANFFAHMEEIDFCWRAKNKGYKIYYSGMSKVYHVGGGTLKSDNPRKTYLNFRNNLLMLYKNLNEVEFNQVLNKRRYLDVIAGLRFFLKGNYKNSLAIFNAYKDFKKIKKFYPSSEKMGLFHSEIYQQSIIKSYFLKGLNKFSDLKFL